MPAIATTTTISFKCDGCGRPFNVPANFAGRKATCKTCGARVVVPGGAVKAAVRPQTPHDEPAAEAVMPPPSNGKPHPLVIPPTVVEPPRPAATGEAAISTADATQSTRRIANVAMVSEAQSPPSGAVIVTLDAIRTDTSARRAAPPDTTQRAASPTQGRPKVPVRVRRLMIDAEQIAAAFSGDGPIRIKSATGDPPELYQIEYHIKGLQRGWLGKPKTRTTHLVEIQLTSEYPRVSPKCRMLTPIFHPNIDESTICVGDHWTAGERLMDLIVRIGEMIAYQAYNIKSPLDGEAAMWADLHPKKLPVDSLNLHPGEKE